MFDIRRSGPSIDALVASMRDVPARVIPYATATALTKAAKRGQLAVIAEMRASFDRPVAYTLGATRIEIATAQKLNARIAVKDQAGGGTNRPTNYLLPEVEGGGRNEKGLERALRLAGVLRSGERAMPGAGVQRDGSGNVSGAVVRGILRQVSRQGAGQRRKSGSIYVGQVGRKQTRGIWQREGRTVKPLFIFTQQLPTYRPRLDFTGAASSAVRDGFASDFYAAASALQRKF
jgi:hypothetical protein